MRRVSKLGIIGLAISLSGIALPTLAQEGQRPVFRVKVDMVVLSFTVTDSKGHYINGLKPSDFHLTEDTIPQKINTFGEGNKPPVQILDNGTTRPLVASVEGKTGDSGENVSEVRSDSFV